MTHPIRTVLASILVALAVAACSGAGGTASRAASSSSAGAESAATSTTTSSTALVETTTTEGDSIADRIRPAGSALFDPSARPDRPTPVALSVPSLSIADTPIVDVGVEPNGEMEIPGAREVGWYRFGSVPGHEGSAVLAAHIAFDGVDGVFRDLSDLGVGETFSITFDDGTVMEFVVTETGQYGKTEIPFDRMFADTGGPEVALVTCGGDFNRSLRSYSDNVIAFARPTG